MSYDYVLEKMVLTADPFALCRLEGVGQLGLGSSGETTLHYILSGKGQAIMADGTAYRLEKGTLLLIPALSSHILKSCDTDMPDPFPTCRPAELGLLELKTETQNEAQQTSLKGKSPLIALCARMTLSLEGVQGLLELVRDPMHEQVSADSSLGYAMKYLIAELVNPSLGSRAMIETYLMQAMLELLRQKMNNNDRSVQWMAALKDQSIWAALQAMMERPGDPHSVESLADIAGMSRSAFAQRFSAAYGSGPLELLRNIRMQQATTLLSGTDLPVKRIAQKVGFRSRSAFSRMFETIIGQSPRAYRQALRTTNTNGMKD